MPANPQFTRATDDLFSAARIGNLEKTISALKNGADLNAVDTIGFSALMFAASNGGASVVQELLAQGAKNDLLRNTLNAFDLAMREANPECARFLLPFANPDRSVHFSGSALHLAARAHQPQSVDCVALTASKSRAKILDADGNTPLMKSVGACPESFALLLPISPLGVVNHKGQTALSLLAFAALALHPTDHGRAQRWAALFERTWGMAKPGQQNTALRALAKQTRWREIEAVAPLANADQLTTLILDITKTASSGSIPPALIPRLSGRRDALAESCALREAVESQNLRANADWPAVVTAPLTPATRPSRSRL